MGMVSRFAISVSVVSVASLFALWSACKSDSDYGVPPGAKAPDARVYMDAHEFHDAHIYMDAPAPRSCTNHANPVMMGSGASETETLIVTFDCGGYSTPGNATPTMQDANGVKSVLPPYNFQCGFNVMTFNTQVTLTVYEITAPAFDIFCN
jgi:hypothetical protein